MTSKRLLSAAIVPLLGWTAIASAQDKPARNNQGTAPSVSKDELKKGIPFCHKASEVVGAKVQNTKGEDLGKVEELVIDPSTGSIDYAVISFGGFLGMGDKFFAVPFSLLKAPEVPEGNRWAHFTFDADKSRLEKAPGFDKSNWPDIAAATWSQDVDRFYNTTRTRLARAEGDDLTPPKEGKAPSDRSIDANKSSHLCKASDLIGKTVENPSNDNLGEVKELVLDPRRSRVSYFVMKSGGFLGMGDKLFAIPWSAVNFHREDNKEKLILNATKERFEKAPEYADKDWNRMADPVWVEGVYTYYGSRPYWKGSQPVER